MVGLLTLYCRLGLWWYCSVTSGALRIAKLSDYRPTHGRNHLRDRTKASVSGFTVGCEWAFSFAEVAVGDQADGCVICKLDDGVGAVCGHAVMGEQGIEERAEHSALGCAGVESQGG